MGSCQRALTLEPSEVAQFNLTAISRISLASPAATRTRNFSPDE